MKRGSAVFFVSISALLWGSTAAVAKLLLKNLDNLQILPAICLFSAVFLFIMVVIRKKLHVIAGYRFKDYIYFAWMGFLGVFLYTFLLYKALSLMPAQEAFIINYLWPVMVVIFSAIVLKEKFTPRKIAGMAVSFLGIFIVISKGDLTGLKFDSPAGILSAVSGAVCYGLFSALEKKHGYEKISSIMFYYFFSFIYSLAAVLWFSEFPSLGLKQLAGLAWLGAFVNGLSTVCWFLALKYGDTARISNIILVTPFMSLIYIQVLLGERVLLPSITGLFVIVAGIIVQNLKPGDSSRGDSSRGDES